MCRDTHVEVSGHPQMLSLPFSLSETSLLLYARLSCLASFDISLLSISCYLGDRTALGSQTLGLLHLGFCVGAGNLKSSY